MNKLKVLTFSILFWAASSISVANESANKKFDVTLYGNKIVIQDFILDDARVPKEDFLKRYPSVFEEAATKKMSKSELKAMVTREMKKNADFILMVNKGIQKESPDFVAVDGKFGFEPEISYRIETSSFEEVKKEFNLKSDKLKDKFAKAKQSIHRQGVLMVIQESL